MKKLAMGVGALATTMTLTSCGLLPGVTVEQIPLPSPGGIGDGLKLSATFDNALNLPAQAKVRLGGTDVGEVTDISAKDYKADVKMNVSKDIQVPVGTGAELRQATPLGDVFVALLPPSDTSSGYMKDGDRLTGDTSAAATVEDLLVSMTSQVDSGSIGSLQEIFTELSTAISGNSSELAGSINGFTDAIAKFNDNSDEVDKAMAETATLTGQLADGREQIAAAINKLPPAINAVNDNLDLVLSTLDKTNSVTAATNDFLDAEKDNLVEMLGHLNTTLEALDKTAPQLGPLMDRLAELTPKFRNSTQGNAALVSGNVYFLSPGVGFDSRTRLPELNDLEDGVQTLQQTLEIIIRRMSAGGN